MATTNREFMTKHPVATRVRAILKSADITADDSAKFL
jgi:hypothetical protein